MELDSANKLLEIVKMLSISFDIRKLRKINWNQIDVFCEDADTLLWLVDFVSERVVMSCLLILVNYRVRSLGNGMESKMWSVDSESRMC